MRPLLAIETSGPSLGVALRAESGLLFEENVTAGALHGNALAPLLQKALGTAGLRVADLEAVAVSLGPGSWTGLRIGLSAAKTLAWAAPTGLVGVPSFEALAWRARVLAADCAILTVRDARSEGLFAALFDETSPQPRRLIAECVLKAGELIGAVEQALRGRVGSTRVVLCGEGRSVELLAAEAQIRGWQLLRQCEHIEAGALAECAWTRLRQGRVLTKSADIHKLAPMYLRASDPELKLARRSL